MSDKKTIKFYDEYVQRQVQMGVNHRHISIINILEENGLKSSDDILEIGCGVGPVTGLIASQVSGGRIIANDISEKSVDAARDLLAKYKNVDFLVGSIVDINVEGQFDWIALPDVLEHIPIEFHDKLFQKLKKLLRPEGRILVHIPQEDYLKWVHKNKPELLQEIDQPLALAGIIKNLEGSELHLTKMEDYSIYVKPYDYRYLIIEHKFEGEFNSSGIKPHSWMEKVKFKLKYK